jgi:hypothetical protein
MFAEIGWRHAGESPARIVEETPLRSATQQRGSRRKIGFAPIVGRGVDIAREAAGLADSLHFQQAQSRQCPKLNRDTKEKAPPGPLPLGEADSGYRPET